MNYDELVAIDVHTHAETSVRIAPDEAEKEWLEARGRYFKYQPVHPTIPQMAAYYRARKMAFVVFTVDSEKEMGQRRITNEEVAELAAENADVAIPFASIDPARGKMGAREARRLIKDFGVRGFKFHPSTQGFYPNDRAAYVLYEAIAEAGLPALFHTGQTGVGAGHAGRRRHPAQVLEPDATSTTSRSTFPTMPIILAHPSFPWQEEALSVATHKPHGLHRPVRLVAEVFPTDARAVREHAAQAQGAVRLRLPGDHARALDGGLREARRSSRRSGR